MGLAAILKTVLVLVLRILTLLALAASVVFMVLNNFTDDIDGSKTNFTDLIAYRYVVVVGGIGFVYTVIQIPFAIYDVGRGGYVMGFSHNLISTGTCKMIAFLLASGVGFGFGVTFEFKKAFGDLFSNKANQFLNKGLISTGLLLLGFLFMALLSIFSSIPPSTSSNNKSFFG